MTLCVNNVDGKRCRKVAEKRLNYGLKLCTECADSFMQDPPKRGDNEMVSADRLLAEGTGLDGGSS